jgi:CRP-like cAMP-binding protein
LEAFVGKRAYEHSAYALEISRLLCFDRKEALVELLEDLDLASVVLRAMASKVLVVDERLNALLSGGALERVAQTLWQLAHPSNAEGGSALELTNERLAALVGASPQTVSSCLCKLEKRGIIAHRRGRIVILSAEHLQACAGRGA